MTMRVTWLHISDLHLRGGDSYDRDVVLRALITSVGKFRESGRRPDLIFTTGDVAHGGKREEYKLATTFFDALLKAAGLERRQLFVVPGNHDVDRDLGTGLARSLESVDQADRYFGPTIPKPHLTQKQGAYLRWYKEYFEGVRRLASSSTCGPVEVIEIRGCRIGVLCLNSALFCQDDNDHEKLWIGRRCLETAIESLQALNTDLRVALVHHPLDWLSGYERPYIQASLLTSVDILLRGHLHESEAESVVSWRGELLHVAAGTTCESRWPRRALYGTFEGQHVAIFPIRYEGRPQLWTVDPSVFPTAPGYEGRFPIARLATPAEERPKAPPAAPGPPVPPPRYPSNIASRLSARLVGRDELLQGGPRGGTMSRSAFVSYSWDDDAHKEWVRALAERLRADGVDITLDRWAAVPGDQLSAFMEQAIRENRFVVIICTVRYKRRSDAREGGVGYEGDIMTAEAMTRQNDRKFIPVWRNGTWPEVAPSWLAGKYYINLTGNPYSERQYEDLVRTLLGVRETAPPLGEPMTTVKPSADPDSSLQRRRNRDLHTGPWKCDRCGAWVGVLVSFVMTDQGVRKSYACDCGGEYWPAP
jgi:predicted phosphodiesterase